MPETQLRKDHVASRLVGEGGSQDIVRGNHDIVLLDLPASLSPDRGDVLVVDIQCPQHLLPLVVDIQCPQHHPSALCNIGLCAISSFFHLQQPTAM